MTILVTGASGAFGRILCAALRDNSAEDVVASGRREADLPGYVRCDLTDRIALHRLVMRARPRLVYHLAGGFTNQYDLDFAINARAARHLLESLREAGGRGRTVLLGSAAEYGMVAPEENPVGEDRVLRPVSVYGVTKACQTHIACCAAYQHGDDVVVARMFNLLAPGLSERLFVGRVERQIERYKRGDIGAIEVGNLASSRDYVSGDDAMSQIRAIAAHGEAGSIYHVGSGVAIGMRELLRRMLADAGVPGAPVTEAPATAVRAGYDASVIYADMRRTRALQERSR